METGRKKNNIFLLVVETNQTYYLNTKLDLVTMCVVEISNDHHI